MIYHIIIQCFRILSPLHLSVVFSIVKFIRMKNTVLGNASLPDIRSTSSTDAKSEFKENCILDRQMCAFESLSSLIFTQSIYINTGKDYEVTFPYIKMSKRQSKVAYSSLILSYNIRYFFY